MWAIIKIANKNSIRKQSFVFIEIIVIFLLMENYNQRNESIIWAKVNFTGPY